MFPDTLPRSRRALPVYLYFTPVTPSFSGAIPLTTVVSEFEKLISIRRQYILTKNEKAAKTGAFRTAHHIER